MSNAPIEDVSAVPPEPEQAPQVVPDDSDQVMVDPDQSPEPQPRED